uniref:Uncharacterized protein n=1 Tax=Physcomitrium patens TaxID=3218 RepID=A0A2K1IVA4_PHYPA|nr:hypothetical protein PHYPA_025152 [Physcomitrium patens]
MYPLHKKSYATAPGTDQTSALALSPCRNFSMKLVAKRLKRSMLRHEPTKFINAAHTHISLTDLEMS